MKSIIATFLILTAAPCIKAQDKKQALAKTADSIRTASGIPELAYVTLTADSILAKNILGYHRVDQLNDQNKAKDSDYFHLGSNTKAITGFIAASLVESKKISWDTKFFSLFPELKKDANPDFYEITLAGLLSHRSRVKPYTSGAEFQSLPKFNGLQAEQRRQFAAYLVKNDALPKNNEVYNYSNAGYSIAASMLEKASGKTWEQLLDEILAKKLKLNYKPGWPNRTDTDQPWGHWIEQDVLAALPPATAYNLNLIEPAGDISMPLDDYARFVQMNLAGLRGKSNFLKAETYNYLHYGLEKYAIGWLNTPAKQISEHAGSVGTFYCYTLINKEKNLAYIVIANCATETALKGIFALLDKMIRMAEAPR